VNNAVVVALIVLFGTVTSPLFLSYLNNRQRRDERREDYARQDAVAEQAAEAARLLLESNKRVAATAVITNGKLDVIHTLVNSNMTAAMQAELDRTQEVLVMLREVIALNEAAGRAASPETLARIDATERKVGELVAALNDRLTQTRIAQQQHPELG
jgi:hypothetical protein